MGTQINAALTSFGMSGEYFHAPFLHVNPNFNLVKVMERHLEKSKQLYPYVKVVRDFKNILNDDKIDLVVINTPNFLHFEMAKNALLAGKHVIIEKPFTRTVKEAEELIELAAKQKRVLSVYQNRRWDGDFLTVKKIIQNKLLGDLVEFRSHFDRYRNFIKPNTWKEEDYPDSGLLYDIGPHLIDQAARLFGKPNAVYADLRMQRSGSKIIDNFEIVLSYPNLKVILNSGFLYKKQMVRFALFGTNGSFIKNGLDPQEDTLKKNGFNQSNEWGTEPEKYWGYLDTQISELSYKGKIETVAGCYQKYYENIYETISEKKELEVKPEQVLITSRIIELALESSTEKKTINYSK